MTTDTVPYVRTIVLPPRQLTDWEVEMLRAAQNTQRIYGDEIRPAKSRCPYLIGKPLPPAILMLGEDAPVHITNKETLLYSVPLTGGCGR